MAEVKKMMEENNEIWKQRVEGIAPIHVAVGCGQLETAKLLLSAGELVSTPIFLPDHSNGPTVQVIQFNLHE